MRFLSLCLYILIVAGPASQAGEALCPQKRGPLNLLWTQAKVDGPALTDGTYQLQQAQVQMQIPSNQALIEVHYLKPQGLPVAGILLCPQPDLMPDTGANLKVITEAVPETVIVQDGQILLKDHTRLWELVVLVIDNEVHLQDVNTSPLDLNREGLSPLALTQVEDLEFLTTEKGLLVKYQNVLLYYTKN